MKSRSRKTPIVFCALVGIALVIWIAIGAFNSEPRYKGRKLSQWLNDINEARSVEKSEPALQAIRVMGTNALPFLLANIRYTDSKLKESLIGLAQNAKIDLFDLEFRKNLKGPTCLALKELGSNAAPIVPALGELISNGKNSGWATTALFSIGSAAAPGLERGCESPNPELRRRAAIYLCKVIEGGQRGWSWGWNPNRPGGKFRFGVGSTYGGEDDAYPLARLLKHQNPAVRRASAEAIMAHCSDVKGVLKHLKAASNDPDEAVRIAVERAIEAMENVPSKVQ